MTSVPLPCCIPSQTRLTRLVGSAKDTAQRIRARGYSKEGLIRLDGGWFLMGSESKGTLPEDGEAPVRRVFVDPFWISPSSVTNQQFADFVHATGYTTEAETYGWTFVFKDQLTDGVTGVPITGTPWWWRVNGASWSRPYGPDSSIGGLDDHPVVHVTYQDANAYCHWAGVRLPTEAEWEFAARGGMEQQDYPWGDELTPSGKHFCNVWQGNFPDLNLLEDGYGGTAPVESYQPNRFGLLNVIGNVWEWCADYFHVDWHVLATKSNPLGPPTGTRRVLRGGSYLCHESYCRRYRNSARTSNSPDSSAGNIGFRVVCDI